MKCATQLMAQDFINKWVVLKFVSMCYAERESSRHKPHNSVPEVYWAVVPSALCGVTSIHPEMEMLP